MMIILLLSVIVLVAIVSALFYALHGVHHRTKNLALSEVNALLKPLIAARLIQHVEAKIGFITAVGSHGNKSLYLGYKPIGMDGPGNHPYTGVELLTIRVTPVTSDTQRRLERATKTYGGSLFTRKDTLVWQYPKKQPADKIAALVKGLLR